MKEFVRKNWVWLSNLILIISVIGLLSTTSDPITVLFVFVGTYVISFLTSMKLFKREDNEGIGF
jgi:Mg2+/citrate symporter